jgi:hypothetical protein
MVGNAPLSEIVAVASANAIQASLQEAVVAKLCCVLVSMHASAGTVDSQVKSQVKLADGFFVLQPWMWVR